MSAIEPTFCFSFLVLLLPTRKSRVLQCKSMCSAVLVSPFLQLEQGGYCFPPLWWQWQWLTRQQGAKNCWFSVRLCNVERRSAMERWEPAIPWLLIVFLCPKLLNFLASSYLLCDGFQRCVVEEPTIASVPLAKGRQVSLAVHYYWEKKNLHKEVCSPYKAAD